MPVSRAFSKYLSGSPAKEPSLQIRFTELPQRVTLHLQSPFQPYLKVPGRWTRSRLSNWAPIKRVARPQSLPFVTFRAPSKGAPSRFPNRAPIEREMPRFQSPLTIFSQSSWWMDMSVHWALFPISFQIPWKETPQQSYRKERCSLSRALQLSRKILSQQTPQVSQRVPDARGVHLPIFLLHFSLKVPSKWAPLHVPQQGPNEERSFISRANGLFIHLFTHLYLSESPIMSPST